MKTIGAKASQFRGTVGTPLLYAAGAVALGMGLPRFEAAFLPDLTAPIGAGPAIAVLSAIASGMLPLTGLVFSLAFVMVQFSATAYSPRLVTWFAGSAMMSHSLGIFTATFLYSLAALAWVDRGGTGKVPFLTVWCAIVLLLLSVVFFVLLVEKLAMLQISRVLAYAGDQGRAVIERDYAPLGDGGPETGTGRPTSCRRRGRSSSTAAAPRSIQAIDVKGLVALAEREGAVVAMAWAVGDTLFDGIAARCASTAGGVPCAEHRLRRLVRLGPERTFEQDPKYALRILVDIAIKALSPAINDPTTAVQALDQVEDLLLRLGRVNLAAGRVRDGRGSLRLVFPVPRWEDFLVLAFDEIRYCGASSIQVMRRMRALLQDLMAHVPPERRRGAAALPGAGRQRHPPDLRGRRRPEGRPGGGPPGARPVAGAAGSMSGLSAGAPFHAGGRRRSRCRRPRGVRDLSVAGAGKRPIPTGSSPSGVSASDVRLRGRRCRRAPGTGALELLLEPNAASRR